ncbi:DUF1835 domain-containing protein [Bacillus massiliigorillae]|uniref:DUF1835 domain-containing protein n=1 Tax=Bacillus massiliigorillae TaxID=1243664 RepID=UPI0003AAF4D0|nr:DUF1835 domain-containing protein [Bacillus massiliigorillae]
MIDEIKSFVKNSSEDEVRSLLFLILFNINMIEESNFSEEQFTQNLKKIYKDFLNYHSTKSITPEKNYKVAHIVFGDSPSGSLKMMLRDMDLEDTENVIHFSDLFSIGPVWKLHEEIGLNKRAEWLKNHINFEEEYIDKYQDEFTNTMLKIHSITSNTPIVIWTGENSHEQTALRYVLYLLREKTNNIFLIDTTTTYKNTYHMPDAEYYPLHTGEIIPEKLRMIYEENRMAHPLSWEERKKLEDEWEMISTKQEVLRIWGKEEIHSVDEGYYDDFIIDTTLNLHNDQEVKGFLKSARVIGQVLGYLNQYIGDLYIEYRVRHLIINGVFEIQGIPKAMRFYSVKLR